MKAIIKSLHSPDVYDLESYHPVSEDDFSFLLQILAGPEGGRGKESFSVVVCTPKWIQKLVESNDFIFGRHYIIVKEYNFIKLKKIIEDFVSNCSGKTWHEVAEKIGRLGHWEFEDYQEYKG